MGCEQAPLYGMLTRGYTPPSLLSLGSTPFWCDDFTPLWHVADWYAPDWLKNTAGWRLFQLVVVVARRKTIRPTSNRPTAHTRSNVIIIRDEHTGELGSVITAYRTMIRHYESSRSWVTPMSCSHVAPSAPKLKNADTDTY